MLLVGVVAYFRDVTLACFGSPTRGRMCAFVLSPNSNGHGFNPCMKNPSMHENPFVHDSWMKTLSCMIRPWKPFHAWKPFYAWFKPFYGGKPANLTCPQNVVWTTWESRKEFSNPLQFVRIPNGQNGLALHHEANLFRSSPFGLHPEGLKNVYEFCCTYPS